MTDDAKGAETIGIVRRLRDGRFSDDELDAMLNRLSELLGDHDINALQVPEDAGPYRAEIVELLARIPEGWGRWISCDAGWYPLITTLGADLARVDPHYEVHQIKEKFGALRFYADTNLGGDLGERFDALIEDAEARSAHICERCGSHSAELCSSGTTYMRYKTLCDACRGAIRASGTDDYRPNRTLLAFLRRKIRRPGHGCRSFITMARRMKGLLGSTRVLA